MPIASPASSMFIRRLGLLLAVIVLGMAALLAQVSRLAVAQGAALREGAESKLVMRDWIPTRRGKILDRKGRVLAQDRPSFDIAVDYRVISGEWAARQGAAAARRANLSRWGRLTSEQRTALADEYRVVYQNHVEAMWARMAQVGGVDAGMLEERRAEVVRQVDARFSKVVARRLRHKIDDKLAAGEEISPEIEDELGKDTRRPIEDQKAPHVLLPKVPDEVGYEFQRLMEEKVELPSLDASGLLAPVPLMPGLTVVSAGDREYPLDGLTVEVDTATLPGPLAREGKAQIPVEGLAFHIVGRMKSEAQAEDNLRRIKRMEADPAFKERVLTPEGTPGLARRLDRGEYTDADAAGLSGVELSQEDELRGLRGLTVSQLETGDTRTIPPVQGRDVRLTIDAMLQARVQAAMSPALGLAVAQQWQHEDQPENPTVPDGTALNGAAVVLQIDSGEVLAMVSTPSIPRRLLKDAGGAFFSDAYNRELDVPWLNRAVARPYPPGSIAKALILNGAVKFGKHAVDAPIHCAPGHLFPDKPDMFRCWIYKAHGGLNHDDWLGHAPVAHEALMVSCNIFFFTLGQRLGPEGIVQTYRMFGVGEPWNLGVGIEYEGGLGPRGDGTGIGISDAIQMGIGQGPVDWTPLHAADAYATLARGGVRLRPRIVDDGSPPQALDLGLDPAAVREALHGLSESVNDTRGTGHHVTIAGVKHPFFTNPAVRVWGKTGTATAPRIFAKEGSPLYAIAQPDPDAPAGYRVLRQGDHSWFVVLVGRSGEERPLYAIAVMMEYAGSGGKVSGPIVNQIIQALIAEKYL